MVPFDSWPVTRWARAHRFLVDVCFAAGLTGIALSAHALLEHSDGVVYRDQSWWTVALVVAACAPVAFRRRNPNLAVLAGLGLQLGCDALRIAGPSWIAVAVLVYGLGCYSQGRFRQPTLVTVAVV